MTSKTSTWFETKVKYQKTMNDGMEKTVREAYVVEADSFTAAEASIMEELLPYITGEYTVIEEKIASYKEIFFHEESLDTYFYKVKVVFTMLDEKTEKEKKTGVYILVEAKNLGEARNIASSEMDKTMMDYSLVSVTETAIKDVFTR